jgi:hypothetical protein
MLEFSAIDEIDPGRKLSAVPPPLLNYGLYTGANIIGAKPAVKPTAEAHAEAFVKNGAPVRAALSHLGGGIRPGNNEPELPGHELCIPDNPALICLKATGRKDPREPPRPAM